MSKTIRTRYAPSPTGYLHIGGLRTALYNYLFAQKNQGIYFLRIEDTDQKRFVPDSVENLLKSLNSAGVINTEGVIYNRETKEIKENGDFGPYVQSQRTEIYRKYAQELINKGHAYYCFCTQEDLEKMRSEQEMLKLAPMYDRRCLKLSQQQIDQYLSENKSHVIRQKINREAKIEFRDLIRGKVSFHGSNIDDQVLLKSDQHPTYHLAHVVDDHLMQTTHVIRGEEWLASTPKHIAMFNAFGWEPPQYGHLSLILNADKTKLSKRQNDVSTDSYFSKGYLKEALINFIALIGWHPGKGIEQEIFTMEELIQAFSFEGVTKAGGIFNPEKLNWFQFQWQKKLSNEKILKIALELDPDLTHNTTPKFDLNLTLSNDQITGKFLTKKALILHEITEKFLNTDLIPTFDKNEISNQDLFKITDHNTQKYLKILLMNEEKIYQTPAINLTETISYLFSGKPLDATLFLNPKMGIEDYSQAKLSLEHGLKVCNNLSESDFNSVEKIKNQFLDYAKTNNLKNGQLLWPIRVALTSEQFSIGAFEAMFVLGKSKSINLLEQALQK